MEENMKGKYKNLKKVFVSLILAFVFVILYKGDVALGSINQKQGINEYHFYNDTIENKDSAKEIQKQIILDGKEISDPGHVFKDKDKVLLKWQDEEGNDIKFDTPIEIKGNDKKIIKVYPVFKSQVVITYYIVGDKNDRVYMTDTINDADSYKLPEDPTIYDANKYFVNWSTSKDGKSGVYDEESLKKDIAEGKTDIKLYAITELKYKATFITGDGASFQEQILADDGSHLEKMPEPPTREGYEFSHWSLKKDGDPVDLNTLELSEDITVYAVWKPVVVDYKFKVMAQNIDDDGYTFLGIISARGLNGQQTSLPFKGSENPDPKVAPTGPIVEDISKLSKKDGRFSDGYNSKDENGQMDHTYTNPQTLDYEGFHLNEEKTKQAFETIEADGSTVVPVYMDRNVHTIWVYKNASATSYNRANWVNATDNNGNIHVDLRYGQSSEQWFVKLNQDYIYYMDKSIGSFYTRAPAMADKDINMYRVYAKGTKFQLRFVEWDPSKFNADVNRSNLATLQNTLGKMKEIGKRVSFQNSEWYYSNYGYRVFEPVQGMWQQITYSWVDKTDHVDDIKGFEPKTGTMGGDNNLQSVDVNNPAFRDYMFAAGKNVGGYKNYTGTPYIENGYYVGFLFYERKTYNINYYSGSTKLASNPYKYEADTSDFGLGYVKGKTTNSKGQVFQGWYEDSEFNVEHKHEAGAKMPAHGITVYAKWDSRKYEVTFHKNQDDYEKDIEKITEIPEADTLYDGKYKDEKVSEENFPKPIQPKDATDFLGWFEKNKNGRFVKANLHKQIKNNDTHLYAKWKYAYLELKYDLNLPETDKFEGTAPTDSSSYITDAKALAADVGDVKVNDGKKVFVGWSESKDGSSGLILPSETVLMDKNKTLYAQWKELPAQKTTKVIYDANGGVGEQYVVEEIITNDTHTVLGNGEGEKINFTREGYVFKGWNTDKNATKPEFQKGNEVYVNDEKEDTNNYIYAIWAPIIKYTTDGNGQVKEGENFVDKTNEEVEVKSNPKGTETKANEGYKFSHWTADKNIELSDGTEIKAGEEITEEQLKQAVITEPLTFTAHFVKDKPSEFNVTHEFKVAEDSPVKEMPEDVKKAVDAQLPENKTAEDGSVVKPTAPKQTEVKDTENDGKWTFEGYKDQNPDTTEVDAKVKGADVKFEGEWKFTPNEHEVTYEYVSGTEGVELPEALKAKAPAKVTGKVKGDTVKSPVPTGDDATFRDDVNKGTWTFKSYDKDSVEITNKDENVKGTWVFTPDVVTEYVDEDGKTIAPKENGTKDKKDIDGYEFVRTEKDEQGNTKHIYKKKVTPPADVVTEYVDEDGKTIAPKENGTKDKKDIDGYEFVRTEKDEQGNTKHIYKKKTTPTPKVVTEYVDEDGNTISPKEDGTQPNKDIDGYEFVRTEKDDKGNTKHIYKKKTTPTPKVVTKFVDENGNPLAENEKGKQDKKDIPNYEFVRTDTDKDGNIVHVYRLKQDPTPSVETRYVDENGNQLLPPKEGTNNPENIDGYTLINTRKDENGNTIHIYSKTPIEGVQTRFVDTDGKQILADKAGTHDPSPINGYEFVGTEKDADGNITHIYRKLPTPPKEVVTKFVDENGLEISDTLVGRYPSKAIPGYEIITTKTDDKGNIIYVYRKIPDSTKVVTEYVDENGKTISPKENGTQPNKDIEGYEFVRTEKDDKGNTKHIYKKKTTPPTTQVVTEYVDENGKTISPKENGTRPNKDIQGYEFIRTEKDEKGNTKHIYKKKDKAPTPTVDKVTKYVDENGNEISISTKGKNPKKNIDGYEFVRTETDKNGNTVHIYKKKGTPTVEKITKFVDEKGNEISKSTKGDNPKKDIDGYEFVRTETDKDGNTVHIYKKKETPTVDKITKFVDEKGNEISKSTKGDNPKKDIEGYEFVKTETDKNGNTVHIYKKKENTKKPGVSTGETSKPNKDNKPNTSTGTVSPGKTTVVPGSTTINQANKKVRGNVRTGVGSSIGALVTLAGSALALFKSKKRK